MMSFQLSDEQTAIQNTVRRFAQEKLLPTYQEREHQHGLDRTLVKEIGDMGMIGIDIPEEYGGLNLDCVTNGLVTEQLCRGDFSVGGVTIVGGLIGGILRDHASEAIKEEWLPGLVSGETLFSIALTEPHAGSDAVNLRLSAKKDGDDYILNGEKTSITAADTADVSIVFVRTGGEGAKGVTAIIVPMDLPGITRGHFNDLGGKHIGRGWINFDGVRVPQSNVIGEEGKGFHVVMHGFDYSRILIGMQCLSAAWQSVDETWKYVSEREAFGRPIAKFQGVSFPLAEAETKLEAARLLCYKGLWLRDQGLPHTKEAAMCKWWPPLIAFEIVHQCILLHGHGGYGDEYPHQQRLRDLLGLQIGDGTAQIQKMVIAREVAGRVTVSHAD